MFGDDFGRLLPLWHDTHVTIRRPPKYIWLMPFIIPIIRRAMFFLSVSFAYSAHPPPPSPRWQNVQFTASALEMNPIEARNSSAGTPFSTRMFVKTSSAIGPVAAGPRPRAAGTGAPCRPRCADDNETLA